MDLGGPRKHVLDGAAHWCNLMTTIQLCMCGGDAVLCQITLTTCKRFKVMGGRLGKMA